MLSIYTLFQGPGKDISGRGSLGLSCPSPGSLLYLARYPVNHFIYVVQVHHEIVHILDSQLGNYYMDINTESGVFQGLFGALDRASIDRH